MQNHLPGLADDLNPPASEKQLAALEKKVGQQLPSALRESYRIHDGHGGKFLSGLIFGLPVLPLKQMLRLWEWAVKNYQPPKNQPDSLDDVLCFPAETVRPVYFDRGWLPFSEDCGGNYMAVDLNPLGRGSVGQVFIYGRDERCRSVLARDWGEFLADIAAELEAGNFRLEPDPDDDEELIFNLARPQQKHFHSAGLNWSRAKLGLESLTKEEEQLWKLRIKK